MKIAKMSLLLLATALVSLPLTAREEKKSKDRKDTREVREKRTEKRAISDLAAASILKQSKKGMLVFTAQDMSSSSSSNPTIKFNSVYGTGKKSKSIVAWLLSPSSNSESVSVQFNLPENLDKQKPVSCSLYFLVSDLNGVGDTVQLRVSAVYEKNNNEIGINSPALGLTEVVMPAKMKVVEPAGLNNLVLAKCTFNLNTALMSNDGWCNLSIERVRPVSTSDVEYNKDIFVSSLSFKYNHAK